MRIDILSLFPQALAPFLQESIIGRAQEQDLVTIRLHNLRDYTQDRRRQVDDRSYGGGGGMVLKPEPIFRAVEAIAAEAPEDPHLILLTPQGRTFHQAWAGELATRQRLLLISGHYEGFDERVRQGLQPEELSIGDYVLTGGEAAALVVVDAVVRLLPGVLGCPWGSEEDSFARGLLEYPHYTRPAEFRGMRVPEVLLSGNHECIARWRRDQARQRTLSRRGTVAADQEEQWS